MHVLTIVIPCHSTLAITLVIILSTIAFIIIVVVIVIIELRFEYSSQNLWAAISLFSYKTWVSVASWFPFLWQEEECHDFILAASEVRGHQVMTCGSTRNGNDQQTCSRPADRGRCRHKRRSENQPCPAVSSVSIKRRYEKHLCPDVNHVHTWVGVSVSTNHKHNLCTSIAVEAGTNTIFLATKSCVTADVVTSINCLSLYYWYYKILMNNKYKQRIKTLKL